MKKFILVSAIVLFFGLAPYALAQTGFVPLTEIPGLTKGATADTAGLANFFNNLYKYLIGLAAALAVIMIIWGGLEISTKDSVSKQSAGKERITQAIFGLVLVLSPVLVFSIINPSILNLSLNLKPLDTRSGAPAQQSQVVNPCDSAQLTTVEREACRAAQNARSQGTMNLTPAEQQALGQAVPIIQQTAETQQAACVAGGGQVYCGSGIVRNNQCTPLAIRQAPTGSCTVLASGCACLK